MHITIIGGSGFVGTRLIEELQKQHTIINIDKQQSPFFPQITCYRNMSFYIPQKMILFLKLNNYKSIFL
ncbi:MAG: NAD-dependent epimerase/dehydratase family protein [Chitinophagaceae bacterium]|nr:NAD-dependent epimerase/dehydratase family protein [Chitinophagaceae bacterium]